MKTLFVNFKLALAAAAVFLSVSGQGAVTHLETEDYSRISQEVERQVAQYGVSQVLVVFDIDNTLLVNQQDLGTDQWFEWQKNLIAANQFEHAVAKSFGELIETQTLLYSLGKMRETEPIVSNVVEQIQAQGITTLVLTARDGSNRDATLRELARNGLKFDTHALSQSGFASRYLPYDLGNPERFGFSKMEAAQWGLKPAREVAYTDGVFMVAGQHKGALLRTLLHRTGDTFQSLVFVDDKVKNVNDVGAAFENSMTEVTLIRYSREDETVARFERGDKTEVKAQWNLLSNTLKTVFGRGSFSNVLSLVSRR